MGEPLFIVGTRSSGAVRLADVLGSHPDRAPAWDLSPLVDLARAIAAPQSLGKRVGRVLALLERHSRSLPAHRAADGPVGDYLHGVAHLRAERSFVLDRTHALLTELTEERGMAGLARFAGEVLDRHAARCGKREWMAAGPALVEVLPLIDRLFPTGRVVHVVRDGRDVVVSALQRRGGARTVEDAAAAWSSTVDRAQAWSERHATRYHLVRFDDVLVAPDHVLASVVGWMDRLDPAEALARTEPLLQRYRAMGLRLDPRRSGRWREVLSPAQVDAVERIAGRTLSDVGFPLATRPTYGDRGAAPNVPLPVL